MSRLRAVEPVEVDLGPCECPDTPHPEGDKAWLRPRLTPGGGMEATYILTTAHQNGEAVTARLLGMCFLTDGLMRWTLLDDDGKPIPANEETLASGALDWDTTLAPIAEKADTLYAESVLRPLLARLPRRSRNGQTAASTSPNPASSSENPTPSELSTTSITPRSRPTGPDTDIGSSS